MQDSHETKPPSLGTAFYKIVEGRPVALTTEELIESSGATYPNLTLDDATIANYRSLDYSEGAKALDKVIDGQFASNAELRILRSKAKSGAEIANDQIGDQTTEIDGIRTFRDGFYEVNTETAPPAADRRWNWNPVSLMVCAVVTGILLYAVRLELFNAATFALTIPAIDLMLQGNPTEKFEKACAIVFTMVASSFVMLKVLDYLLPWEWRAGFRRRLLSLGAVGLVLLVINWGLLSGQNSVVDVMQQSAAASGSLDWLLVSFFVLQMGVFIIANYGLSVLAFQAWDFSRQRISVEDRTRQACNKIAGPKLGDRALWISVRDFCQELLLAEAGHKEEVRADAHARLHALKLTMSLSSQKDNAEQQLNSFKVVG